MSKLLEQKDIELIEETFSKLVGNGDKLVESFYTSLFTKHPEVKPMFSNVNQKEQEKKLLSGLALVVNNLRNPDVLAPALSNLGKNHQKYGAVAEHYPVVVGILIEVMSKFAGDLWTEDVKHAWTKALNAVAESMLSAYENSDNGTKIEEEQKMDNLDSSDNESLKQELEKLKNEHNEQMGRIHALNKVQAVIEFDLDGTIIIANDNFLNAMGYSLEEIQGKHHSIFVEPDYKESAEYKNFWEKLNRGEFDSGEYKRIGKGGKEIWINASYNPVYDDDGKVYKIIKFATDVTDQKMQYAEFSGKLDAVSKTQAVIEFNLDGTIITANENFTKAVGYSLEEIKGRHHSMFVSPEYAESFEYKEFWKKLSEGQTQTGQYKRFNKNGDEIWLNASYNAVFDMNGKPFKVVKYATDGTELRAQQLASARLQVAVDGAQSAMIMINRDFEITYINEATRTLLKKYESKFKDKWSSFDVDSVMGTCIDMFHKNPSHQRKMLEDPSNLPYQTDIDINGLKFSLMVTAQLDLNGNYIGNTLEWEDVTEQRQKELEVARLQSAVDGSQANLMLCDEDLNITYANPSVVEMMRNRQNELRAIWPGLDVDNLVGQNIDQFHKNPSHQRRLLADIKGLPASAEIKVAELEFSVNATAITDNAGNYMGNMVEWRDITEQKDAERQIEHLIDSAINGELDSRLETDNYKGFMYNLATSINKMMDTVVEPIKESTRVIERLADGDLTQTMDGEFKGQFLTMQGAVNTSISNLFKMVDEIRGSASSINTSANEIAQGNLDLSQRTEEQASSLEETASSIEEMTGTVKQNADNAQQANQLATGACMEAEKGGSVVSDAIAAMTEINQASKKIADIIGVIDEIAFQTNLLALNAAVEAARAGEQGRGFAVVAAEVRNLAQRSAGAAKEIKTLINDSVQKVEEGSKLVDKSGSTLEQIVNSVKKVSDIIAEIAAASNEQSTGIDQINKAVSQMDEMTQQNASLVEEAAAASESMDEQAKGLTSLIGFFNVGDSASGQLNRSFAEEERRSNVRPWKEETQTQHSPKPNASLDKKAASGGDSDWEEF
jgi:methyl-accepting chemotaxis protein